MRIIAIATLVIAGCAAQPANEAPGVARTTASTEPQAQLASTGQSVTEQAFRPPQGYRLRPDRGANVYCTKTIVLGSRFPKEDCRTEAELRDIERQKESMRGEMDQRIGVCASKPGCAFD